MARENVLIHTMNGGEVSPLAMARIDLDKARIMASLMSNVFPMALGPMRFRPGMGYQSASYQGKAADLRPFIFSSQDVALLEFTDKVFRPLVNGQPVTRPTVASAVTNGNFAASAGWTLGATAGASAAISGGRLEFNTSARGSDAFAKQKVTVAVGDRNKEHGLRVSVERGPIYIRIGSVEDEDEFFEETILDTGEHSLSFTPTGDFWVKLIGYGGDRRRVKSCTVEGAGSVTLATPWASADLPLIRTDQSGDVVFIAAKGYQMRRIERRQTRSWSLVEHLFDDGPFFPLPTAPIKMRVHATTGLTTLETNKPFFKAAHVGALFRLFHENCNQTVVLADENQFTDPIRITGVLKDDTDDRRWEYTITGTWAGKLRWQRSYDGGDIGWRNYRKSSEAAGKDITSNVANQKNTDDDGNAITYYRLGFDEYSSGAATVNVRAGGSGGWGICRVLSLSNSKSATVEVLKPFYNTRNTRIWQEGMISERRGYPSAVSLHDGRLWVTVGDKVMGSVSDAFNSLDVEQEGDAGPIVRSIATGGINPAHWMLSLGRLIIGTSGAEAVPRSSNLDAPMTPTDFAIADAGDNGSANLAAAKVNRDGVFIHKSSRRLMSLSYSADAGDYVPSDLSSINPELFDSDIKGVAVQRLPETRIWAWLASGKAVVLTYAPEEGVFAFSRFETDGKIKSMCVTPNLTSDDVWFNVERTLNGVVTHVNEKLAYDDEAVGGLANKQADCFIYVDQVASTTIPCAHLNGRQVIVWADGKEVPGTFTVAGGVISVPTPVSKAVVGLYYEGAWRSAKLAYAARLGTALNQPKKVDHVGFVLSETHWRAIQVGQTFDKMDPLPATYRGRRLDYHEIFSAYDDLSIPAPGSWDTDARVCLKFTAPLPATVMACTLSVQTHDK